MSASMLDYPLEIGTREKGLGNRVQLPRLITHM
jgi:hypothetical protein